MTSRRITATAVVVVLVVAVVVAGCSGGGGGSVGRGLDFAPVSDERSDAPVYLLPTDLDVTHEVTGALDSSGEQPAGSTSAGVGIVLAAPTADGWRDVLLVGIEASSADRDVSDREADGLTYIDVDGTEARVTDTDFGVSVDWFDGLRTIGVIGPPGAVDLVVEVAQGLDPSASPDGIVGMVPDGHEVLQVIDLAAADEADPPVIDTTWTLAVTVDGARLSVSASTVPVDALPLLGAALAGGEVRTIDVRGTSGVWSTRESSFEGSDGVGVIDVRVATLTWVERPGLTVNVSGDAEIETLLVVAESLVEVGGPEFQAHQADLGISPSTTEGQSSNES